MLLEGTVVRVQAHVLAQLLNSHACIIARTLMMSLYQGVGGFTSANVLVLCPSGRGIVTAHET